jgi:hypothetical protein
MDVHTCKHPACSCQLEGGKEFCSTRCENASKDVARNNTCDCGHPHCERRP